jgi:cytochrome c peroxidase
MRASIEVCVRSLLVMVSIAAAAVAVAQTLRNPRPLDSLQPDLITEVPRSVPDPVQLAAYIADKTAALKLGKALFWDMQVGSDGITACASCHFHAGADSRSKNQVSPGVLATPEDVIFSAQLGGAPNRQLTAADFPFHKLSDPNDRFSSVVSDTNDVVSSQSVHFGLFKDSVSGQPIDDIEHAPDPDGFRINQVNVRRVEGRNTPTVINAVFNRLLFWDGRANAVFNGIDSSGKKIPLVYKANKSELLTPVSVQLEQSPLASQALTPPLSAFEMSASKRSFQEVGQKFLRDKSRHLHGLRPLARQVVHSQDSVLGQNSSAPKPGLNIASYDKLVQQAFRKEWWQSKQIIEVNSAGTPTVRYGKADPNNPKQYDLMDWNFPLFFGLAVQEYLATLVDGDSPFDRFQKGATSALNPRQIAGLNVFISSGCLPCHRIPEFTTASVGSPDAGGSGFRNTGVRPFADDSGRTGGAFKVPTLRNVELTAPYMHNGGMATLEQVVDFYNRGASDFDIDQGGVRPLTILDLSSTQKADLVTFLKSLTDERVRFEKAPFDHPQLFVPNGHPLNQLYVTPDVNQNAVDDMIEIPAVGRNGGPDITPRSFLQQ